MSADLIPPPRYRGQQLDAQKSCFGCVAKGRAASSVCVRGCDSDSMSSDGGHTPTLNLCLDGAQWLYKSP